MKTLIINGSPRPKGDTVQLINLIVANSKNEVVLFNVFKKSIRPCIDCRFCWKNGYCVIKDDFQQILDDSFDNIIVASPIHMGIFPAPLIAIISRFQAHYSSKRFLNKKITCKEKKGALILIGGGDGEPSEAINLSKILFSNLNAINWKDNSISYLNTDNEPLTANINEDISIKVLNLVKELEI